MIVDITRPPGKLDERIAEMVRRSRSPKILVMNKVDQRNPDGAQYVTAYQQLAEWDMEHPFDTDLRTRLEQIRMSLDIGFRLKRRVDDRLLRCRFEPDVLECR